MPARTVRRPVTSTSPAATDETSYDGDGDDTADVPTSRRGSARPARREAPAEPERSSRNSRRAAPTARPVEEPEEDEESSAPRPVARGGWNTFKQHREASSDYATNFKVEPKTTYVIQFLDDEPFAAYRQHWLDDSPVKKKSFVCLVDGCPLCDILNDKPRPLAAFNVIEFTEVIEKGKKIIEPQIKVWEVGSQVGTQLETLADDPKTGPLTDGAWTVSKTVTKNKTTYNIMKVKERDLLEDHGIDPLTDEEFEDLHAKKYDSSVVRYPAKKDLLEIARDLAGDE